MRVAAHMAPEYLPVKMESAQTAEKKNPKTEESPGKKPPVEEDRLKRAVSELNRFLSFYHLQFAVHEASGRYQVKMVDEDTQEVIREWPADTILEISARFKELLEVDLGILLDTRV